MTECNVDTAPTSLAEYSALSATLAKQNDAFRRLTFSDESVGRWLVTPQINAKGDAFVSACVEAVRSFEDFNEDADPYGDHSMGVFEVEGETVWFKIDLYDVDYRYGADEPTEFTKTRRVLTILFPSDY